MSGGEQEEGWPAPLPKWTCSLLYSDSSSSDSWREKSDMASSSSEKQVWLWERAVSLLPGVVVDVFEGIPSAGIAPHEVGVNWSSIL